ncbi:hypothetical protein CPB83DRAFT_131007 [Crepidotus variabilis]|uniref:Uncharacterized protein n=1 Tax=Crepidotus variabilis TaxID=179855 RepID=A0A9P6EMD4_9AGAR|nr:hypothetical protein CPB83DRAFT_131007 [Crepidotus variabilis]
MSSTANSMDSRSFHSLQSPHDELKQEEQAELDLSCARRALHNLDIMNEVFKHLSLELDSVDRNSDGAPSIARRTLLDAACSCRSFEEPALSAMWRVMPSVFPLLKLLPSFIEVNDTYILEEVGVDDWTKFAKRARQVQVLLLRENHDAISPLALIRLQQLHGQPILPALLKISILEDFDVSSFVPLLVLSPSVRSIELRDNSIIKEEFFRSFRASILAQAPLITHLNLNSTSHPLDPSFILTLHSLCDLELGMGQGNLSVTFMIGLGRLHSLRHLTLKMGLYIPPITKQGPAATLNDRFSEFASDMQKLKLFATLESFSLFGRPASTLITLAYMYPLSLKSLNIQDAHDFSSIQIMRKNSTLISLGSIARNLKTFTMKQSSSGGLPDLRSFRSLQLLEILELSGGSAKVTDDDMSTLATNMPHLKILVLPSLCGVDHPSIKFIWCPDTLPSKLECLKICVYKSVGSFAKLPPLPNIIIPKPQAHLFLRTLSISSYFGAQEYEKINQLAKLINYAFPKLNFVEAYGLNAKKECWGRVELFRATLREVCDNIEQEYKE